MSTSAMSSTSWPSTHSTSALSSDFRPSATVPWPSSPQARSAVGKNSPRRRRGRVELDHVAAAQQQRRRMAAVDDRERTAALLDQRRRDEVLLAERAGHRTVEIGDDRPQVGPLVRDVSVGAEDDAGQADGVQALTLDVTDDHAYAVRRVQRLVEIPADVGGGAGRDVPGGDGERPDLWR